MSKKPKAKTTKPSTRKPRTTVLPPANSPKMVKVKLFIDERTGIVIVGAHAGKEVEMLESDVAVHNIASNNFLTSQSSLRKLMEG